MNKLHLSLISRCAFSTFSRHPPAIYWTITCDAIEIVITINLDFIYCNFIDWINLSLKLIDWAERGWGGYTWWQLAMPKPMTLCVEATAISMWSISLLELENQHVFWCRVAMKPGNSCRHPSTPANRNRKLNTFSNWSVLWFSENTFIASSSVVSSPAKITLTLFAQSLPYSWRRMCRAASPLFHSTAGLASMAIWAWFGMKPYDSIMLVALNL